MRAIRALILVAALYWVGKIAVEAVRDLRNGQLILHVRPGWLLLSGALVLATYFLLIWAWLYIIAGLSGRRIRYLDGARIWFISNAVGQYVPGKVWGIIQMGAMSVEAGINPVSAGAASIINTVVNIATGMAVAVVSGTPILIAAGIRPQLAWAVAAAAVIGVLCLPVLTPLMFRMASRLGVRVPEQQLPHRLIAVSAAANVVAWGIYGVAFLCLNHGLVELPRYDVVQHIAVNATSYVVGYLVLIAPGGLGFREAALQKMMLAAHMAMPAQAGAVSIVSRLWQIVIIVLPALIFLAYRRPSNEKDAAAG
jgi:glycosyltransferase 2 family protein